MKCIVRIGALLSVVAAFAGIQAFASDVTPEAKAPAVIHECEMGPGTHMCMTWKWNGSTYEKTGPDGIKETLSIRFDKPKKNAKGTPVTFVRDVKSGDASGLGVVYEAELHDGKIEAGTVTWTYQNIVKSGTWSGTYSYDSTEKNQNE